MMCDATRSETMEEGATLWKKSVDESVCLSNGQRIPCVLLVNKVRCTSGTARVPSHVLFVHVALDFLSICVRLLWGNDPRHIIVSGSLGLLVTMKGK